MQDRPTGLRRGQDPAGHHPDAVWIGPRTETSGQPFYNVTASVVFRVDTGVAQAALAAESVGKDYGRQ